MLASNFFKIIFCVFLLLSPVKAMLSDTQEEETSLKLNAVRPVLQSIPQEEAFPLEPHQEEVLPDDILLTTFRFLGIRDLGRVARVSTSWKRVADDLNLWRYMGLTYYGDFLSEEDLRENPKQKVIFHYLSVIANTTENSNEIERLVSCYRLYRYAPSFKRHIDPLLNFIHLSYIQLSYNHSFYQELIAYGNKKVVEQKLRSLHKRQRNAEARELNDKFVERGDRAAIERKLDGLSHSYCDKRCDYDLSCNNPYEIIYIVYYGYQINQQEARRLNDFLVEEGDMEAIKRKINGLCKGEFGYEKNLEEAREFNELLVKDGDTKAIERKIWGLAEGKYGYNKTLSPSIDLLDFLIEKEDSWAIETKFACLYQGEWGYEKNQPAAVAFLEKEIRRGKQKAIIMKIVGFAEGKYGYERSPAAAREFNDSLVDQGDQYAIKRKIESLLKGSYGYERDPLAAIRFNDSLADNGNSGAIERKIEGLLEGNYGYEQDPLAAREYIESLVICEFPIARAIGKYIKAFAMKYGIDEFGYVEDRQNAIKFIKENHVPY